MKQDTSDYISYLIHDKKIFRTIKNIIITIIILVLLKNGWNYVYNQIHFWRKYYPSDYVETILRQNKKHYQRVADYATSSDIENNYDGDALINSDGYTIGLFDSSLKFDDIRVKWSRDIIKKRQHLWGINGKKKQMVLSMLHLSFIHLDLSQMVVHTVLIIILIKPKIYLVVF